MYFQDASGKSKLNSRDPPCPPPYEDMVIKGYNIYNNGNDVEAWFIKKGVKGARRPNRGSSGTNKEFHSELHKFKRTHSASEVEEFRQANTHRYTKKIDRKGEKDPEL